MTVALAITILSRDGMMVWRSRVVAQKRPHVSVFRAANCFNQVLLVPTSAEGDGAL